MKLLREIEDLKVAKEYGMTEHELELDKRNKQLSILKLDLEIEIIKQNIGELQSNKRKELPIFKTSETKPF